jgi:alkylation response protein AidB-like acyl-CoA dehydrogenase
VRITTIYEGTSEIQQSIIGTHRWRMCVRSKGGFYRDMAKALRELGCGEEAALAADALAETVLAFHAHKLPREQYVLWEMGRLAAEVETAVALAHKAASGNHAQSELLAPAAQLHGGAAARDVVCSGLRLLQATGKHSQDEIAAWREAARCDDALATSVGELEAMDRVAAAAASALVTG